MSNVAQEPACDPQKPADSSPSAGFAPLVSQTAPRAAKIEARDGSPAPVAPEAPRASQTAAHPAARLVSHAQKPSPSAVALCVEGGGMRDAYVGALVCALQAAGLKVSLACGISAGSSVAANFVAGIPWRTRAMFVDAVTSEHFGGWRSFVQGRGYFDADYLYEGCIEDNSYPFDFEAFMANTCNYACQAFEATTGRTVIWQKQDFSSAIDMATHVRASSTMPLLMKPITIDGQEMFDGGLGEGAGLSFTIAEALGYKRFIMVCSRPEGYIKQPLTNAAIDLYFRWAKDKPLVAKALMDRPYRYNETRARLKALAEQGQAIVIYPTTMPLHSTTLNYATLNDAWKAGYAQGQQEAERALAFAES